MLIYRRSLAGPQDLRAMGAPLWIALLFLVVVSVIVESFSAHAQSSRQGKIGVTIQDVTPGLRQQYGLPLDLIGAVLTGVTTGSDAESKGLSPGDVVTAINGSPVRSAAELKDLVIQSAVLGRKAVLLSVLDRRTQQVRSVAVRFMGESADQKPIGIDVDTPENDQAFAKLGVGDMKYNCASESGFGFQNPVGPQLVGIYAQARVTDWHVLTNEADVEGFLKALRAKARRYCESESTADPKKRRLTDSLEVDILAEKKSGSRTVLYARFSQGSWKVSNNSLVWAEDERRTAAAEKAAEEKQRIAAETAARESKARAAARSEFISKNGIQSWTNIHGLRANPFPYKDKIIGIRADFSQMLSPEEATFGDLLVDGVGSTQFTDVGRASVLGVKISGLKEVQTPLGAINLPYGRFVGVYFCIKSNCSDFFDD